MDLWGEIKFWFDRYRAWVLVGLGFIVLTLAFLLISRFSADSDRQMARQAKEVEEVQEVIQEQQFEILGDNRFHQAVQDLPTEEELISYLDSSVEGEIDSYTSEEMNILIGEQYGGAVRMLAREGLILSTSMTADQRLIIQLNQEQILISNGIITEEELLSYTIPGGVSIGIPKPLYSVQKYLGERIVINNHNFGIRNYEEVEIGEYSIYRHSTHNGEIEVGYVITEPVDFGDVSLLTGFVAKGQNSQTGAKVLYTYLVFNPNKEMTGEEYLETIKGLDIQLNHSELSERRDGEEVALTGDTKVLPVHIIDSLYYYGDIDGYDSNDPVSLTIDGKDIGIAIIGTDFEVDIE